MPTLSPPIPSDFAAAVEHLLQHPQGPYPQTWEDMQLARERPVSQLLDHALALLEAEHPLLARSLRLRYLEGMTIRNVGRRLHRAPASVHRDLKAARDHLARILWDLECRARDEFIQQQQQRLEPPTYDRLFGVDALAQSLQQQLQQPSGPVMMLLTGVGGLGKTSLADYLSRKLISDRAFHGFGWISLRPQVSLWDARPHFMAASPEQALADIFESLGRQLLGPEAIPAPFSLDAFLPRLRRLLRQTPHFIVIDNLETLEPIPSLLEIIRSMTSPTRFLFTSRVSLPHQPNLYHQRVPPLSSTAALALLRHEGETRNIMALNQASEAELAQIYQVVGGNPLALKLVAGQLLIHPLHTLLDDLAQARGRSIQRLYDFIYQRAWQSLNAAAQQVLLAMILLPPTGGTRQQLEAITQLDGGVVHDALDVLVQRNLIDYHPLATPGLYTIHSLTRTFLQQIARR